MLASKSFVLKMFVIISNLVIFSSGIQLQRSGIANNATATCAVYEDPHIQVFDGRQVSLLALHVPNARRSVSDAQAGEKWLVKSSSVSIQALYTEDETRTDRQLFVRSVAVGGAFLSGNTIVIGSLENNVTWNGNPILEEESSIFTSPMVNATRGEHSWHVEDLKKPNHGINIELPLGVSLIVNRLPHRMNVAITMPAQQDQDGLCGNNNGFAADDSLEFVANRLDPNVPPEESLFDHSAGLI